MEKILSGAALWTVIFYTCYLWFVNFTVPVWYQAWAPQLTLTDLHECLYHVDAEHCDSFKAKLSNDSNRLMDQYDTAHTMRTTVWDSYTYASDTVNQQVETLRAAIFN